MRLFLSFRFADEWFVHRVNYYLRKQPGIDSYCYSEVRHFSAWRGLIGQKLTASDHLVLFLGEELGEVQKDEASCFAGPGVGAGRRALLVYRCASGNIGLPSQLASFQGYAVRLEDYEADDAEVIERLSDEVAWRTAEELDRLGLGPDALERAKRDLEARKRCARLDIEARRCAELIAERLMGPEQWVPCDGLPIGYPCSYEKDIVEEYVNGKGELRSAALYELGCPKQWPSVKHWRGDVEVENPLPPDEIGSLRSDDDKIIVDARTKYHSPGETPGACCLVKDRSISFPEAGPRARLFFDPREALRVGIVVSGGIAPGINAVIAGIVERLNRYFQDHRAVLTITLYRDGFEGIIYDNYFSLPEDYVRKEANGGGSMIGTSRRDDLLDTADPRRRKEILDHIVTKLEGVGILFVIGGDGSMRAAHAIYTKACERFGRGVLSVVAVPKTMDNDILWVWQAFGFLSAVERARQGIENLHTEVTSNPRLCVIQLFGSDSGFVVSHAALASGSCDAALIPEVPFTMEALGRHICRRLAKRYEEKSEEKSSRRAHATILLAETAIPRDVEKYIDNPSYPQVLLDEEEKRAIREFIGSPLLHVDSIQSFRRREWQAFCKRTVGGEAGSARGWIFSQLPPEVQGILRSVGDKPWDEPVMRSTVIKAMNGLLMSGLWVEQAAAIFPRDKLTPDIRELLDLIDSVQNVHTLVTRGGVSVTSEDKTLNGLKYLLDSLTGLGLPHEANEIRDAFMDYWKSCILAVRGDGPSEEQKLLWTQRDQLLAELKSDALGGGQREEKEREIHSVMFRLIREGEGILQDERPQRVMTQAKAARLLGRLRKVLELEVNRLLLQSAYPGEIEPLPKMRGDRRVHGQTRDALRTAGMKVVTGVLRSKIENRDDRALEHTGIEVRPAPRPGQNKREWYWETFRVFQNEPRHLLRAIPPSVSDVIFGHRLGVLAVDNALAGYTDFMVSQWVTEYVLVPLELVVLGRKRVPQQGMFWKSVLANTKQPPDLTE